MRGKLRICIECGESLASNDIWSDIKLIGAKA